MVLNHCGLFRPRENQSKTSNKFAFDSWMVWRVANNAPKVVLGRDRKLKDKTREVVVVTVGKAIGGNHGIRHHLLCEC